MVLSRKFASRVRLRNLDRLILVWLYRLSPLILNAIPFVKPENHYPLAPAGLPAYWQRRTGGFVVREPKIDHEIGVLALLRRMSRLWMAYGDLHGSESPNLQSGPKFCRGATIAAAPGGLCWKSSALDPDCQASASSEPMM